MYHSSFNQTSFNFEVKNKNQYSNFSPKQVIKRISKAEWKLTPYKAQNWGIWLHHMGPYVGKIKPAMASLLIRYASRKGEIILDPFCGIGTIPLEADLLERIAIGNDLNPYAHTVAKGKFDRKEINQVIRQLDKIEIDISKVDLSGCSDFMKQFYHPETLKEILFFLELLKKRRNFFLLGCLLGIIHGHRPGHLSAITSLVIPYLPRTKPEYKEVLPRLKQKVKRMYLNEFPIKTNGQIFKKNAKKLPLKNSSVDVVISSPPYFNTLDYVADNKLRNEFMGISEEKKGKLKSSLIQRNPTYIEEMLEVGKEMKRVLKKGKYCIFILGDLHSGKKVVNTAHEISTAYKDLGFVTHGIIEDAMPINKAIPSGIKRSKLDRILVMTNGPFKKV